VVLPRVKWQEKAMTPVVVESLAEELFTSERGLKMPRSLQTVALERIDLIVTPGRGFDRAGRRMGRGGAFYDRFFAQAQVKAMRCGLAFAEQVVECVPTASWDEPIDLLVTDEQVIRFNNRKGV
jgi:5-formyltetrahydrofolate cyclo-ligase